MAHARESFYGRASSLEWFGVCARGQVQEGEAKEGETEDGEKKGNGDGEGGEDREEEYGKPAGRVYLESGGEILHRDVEN